jgi:hypothetical protein
VYSKPYRCKTFKEDWIIGFSPVEDDNRLVYLMQLTEPRMNFNDYYFDKRFRKKKPNIKGNYKEFVGDNLYFQNGKKWKQHQTILHKGEIEKDTRHPFVFISKIFFYLGNERIKLNEKYDEFIWGSQSIKYFYNIDLLNELVIELKERFGKTGCIGRPFNPIKNIIC